MVKLFGSVTSEMWVLLRGVWAFGGRTLLGVAQEIVREHYRTNAAALEFRPGTARRTLAWLNSHPKLALFIVFSIYGAAALLPCMVPAPSWAPARPSASDYYRDLQSINFAILGAQTALLGLVYPLVIALVGLMFEARSSTGGRLSIYFKETEALAVGRVSLALVLILAAQAIFYATLPSNSVVLITLLNLVWFAANLASLGFFVVRSLEFVRPARRQILVKSFVANSAWRAELFEAVLENQWGNSIEYGHLPQPRSPSDITVNPYGSGKALLSRRFSRLHVLRNVLFGPLAVVLKATSVDKLSFIAWPTRTYDGEIVLARGDSGNLRWSEQMLIRAAFRFSRAGDPERLPSTERLLTESVVELLELFENRKYEEFDARFADLVELHSFLYALAHKHPTGEQPLFSYAALGSQLSRSIADEWVSSYRDLLLRVADHLVDDWRYFEVCAYLAARIDYRVLKLAPFDARRPLLLLPRTLFGALIDGATRRRAEVSTTPPQRGSLFTLSGEVAGYYRRVWLSFVAAWEYFGENLGRQLRDNVPNWDRLADIAVPLREHLRESALMVGRAAKAGEDVSIGWTVDVLLKWRERTSHGWQVRRNFALKSPLIHYELLFLKWNEVASLPLTHFGEPADQSEIFDTALENLWVDTLVALTASLVQLFGEATDSGLIADGPSLAASGIFLNRNFDPGASDHPREATLTTKGILESIARLSGDPHSDGRTYGNYFDDLTEKISSSSAPNYISMRIYTWVGGIDVQRNAAPFGLMLAASLAQFDGRRRKVDLAQTTSALLIAGLDANCRRRRDFLDGIRTAVAGLDQVRARAVISTLLGRRCTAAEGRGRLAAVQRLLRTCVDLIEAERTKRIAAAPIDPKRLEAIAVAAGAHAFSKASAAFPISRFAKVKRSRRTLKPFTLTSAANRGEFTDPVMADIPVNVEEMWDSVVHERSATLILHDVVSNPPTLRRKAPRTVKGYWGALKQALDDIRACGQTPLIVRANRGEAPWLLDWQYDTNPNCPRPKDALVEHNTQAEDDYDFDLNGAHVFSSNLAGHITWVIPQELLEVVTFQKFDKHLVLANFAADPNDVWKGQLAVTFGREIRLGNAPIWRIDHSRVPH